MDAPNEVSLALHNFTDWNVAKLDHDSIDESVTNKRVAITLLPPVGDSSNHVVEVFKVAVAVV